MLNDFDLTKLPPYLKTLIGLFTALTFIAFLWIFALTTIELGIFGSDENDQEAEAEYDYKADMQSIMADTEAVTAPNWADSGQEEPINADDLGNFSDTAEPTTWEKFVDDFKLASTRLAASTALFFALGFVFSFSTVQPRSKKFIYWLLAISILLYAIGLAVLNTCFYSNTLSYIATPILFLIVLYMCIRIFIDLRRKPS